MRSTSRLVAGGAHASRSCSTSSAFPRPRPRAIRISSAAGSGNASRVRGRSPPTPRYSFLTSPPPAPSLLVLEEPLASLDASAQAQLANLLVDLSRRLSLSLLLISHDLAIVRHVADVVSVMYLGVMVETGPTQPVWALPLHPYTEALIGAVPSPDGRGVLPDALPGEVPDPAHPPAACRFHPRCPYAFDRCSRDDPLLLEVAPGRSAACWLQTGEDPPAPPAAQAQRLSIARAE